MLPTLEWIRGDPIKVQIPDEEFEHSFYPATLLARFLPDEYYLQYQTLLTEDGMAPLREMVPISSVRPVPVTIPVRIFSSGDIVDAWTRDGWWMGTVVRMLGQLIEIHFHVVNEVELFTVDKVRVHQRCRKRERGDEWVFAKKRSRGGDGCVD